MNVVLVRGTSRKTSGMTPKVEVQRNVSPGEVNPKPTSIPNYSRELIVIPSQAPTGRHVVLPTVKL
jgi:hypothetical protein